MAAGVGGDNYTLNLIELRDNLKTLQSMLEHVPETWAMMATDEMKT